MPDERKRFSWAHRGLPGPQKRKRPQSAQERRHEERVGEYTRPAARELLGALEALESGDMIGAWTRIGQAEKLLEKLAASPWFAGSPSPGAGGTS